MITATHKIPGHAILNYRPEEHTKKQNLQWIRSYLRVQGSKNSLIHRNYHHAKQSSIVVTIQYYQQKIISTLGSSPTGYELFIEDGQLKIRRQKQEEPHATTSQSL